MPTTVRPAPPKAKAPAYLIESVAALAGELQPNDYFFEEADFKQPFVDGVIVLTESLAPGRNGRTRVPARVEGVISLAPPTCPGSVHLRTSRGEWCISAVQPVAFVRRYAGEQA
jgi:hypothetical protein